MIFIKTVLLITFLFLFSSCSSPEEIQKKEPDTKYYNGEYEIDINEDGALDLKIEMIHHTYGDRTLTLFYLKPLDSLEILCNGTGGAQYLTKHDTVFYKARGNRSWSREVTYIMHCRYYHHNWRGAWAGKTGYLGVKLKTDSSKFCSWINITADTLRESNIVFHFSRINHVPETDFVIGSVN